MAYTKLWPVIQDQLWSYQDANLLNNSIQFIGDWLGFTGSHTNLGAPAVTVNNDSTDGGAIYFDGGSSVFIKCNQAGTEIEIDGANVSFASGFYVRGQRVALTWFFEDTNANQSEYMSTYSNTIHNGYRMTRGGSILAAGWSAYIANFVGGVISIRSRIYKNGSPLFYIGDGIAITETPPFGEYDTYSWGAQTFVAGDYIDAQYYHPSGFPGAIGDTWMYTYLEIAYE